MKTDINTIHSNILTHDPSLRKSTRSKHPPTDRKKFHCNLLHTCSNNSSLCSPSSIAYPLSNPLSYAKCSPTYKHLCCTISSISEPITYHQASKHDCWKNTMDVEITSLKDNQTWILVDLPQIKPQFVANGLIKSSIMSMEP